MSTRTKEEQLLLDEKIARIQKKNEEILRRQKEIEEDKRLAAQRNALVNLRQSSVNDSRERTPALKPSKREQRREDIPDLDFQESDVMQRSTRGSFRGRGGDRYRGQGDWKVSGPPPDPKSFLYDDERDVRSPREAKSDPRRELDRRRSEDHDRGGRELHRGGRRGSSDYRTDRGGYRGNSRGRSVRTEEEAWRAERLRIDEARIQRQRSADGKWRREWDNEKITLESSEELRYEPRRTSASSQEMWMSSHDDRDLHDHQHHHHHHHHHDCDDHQHHQHHLCDMHTSAHSNYRHHNPNFHQQQQSRGRGRGRLDPAELEMPLDNIAIPTLQQHKANMRLGKSSGTQDRVQMHSREVVPKTKSPARKDDLPFGANRSIECVGESVKISVLNTNVGQSPPRIQRKFSEQRGRFRSRASYSSQSDEDSPRDQSQRGGRKPRNQKFPRGQDKSKCPPKSFHDNMLTHNVAAENITPPKGADENEHIQNKPPLPPLKSILKSPTSPEDKDEDESWEDVTTSGAESMGEDLSSVHSSPEKHGPSKTLMSSTLTDESLMLDLDSADVLEIQSSDLDQDQSGNSTLGESSHDANSTISFKNEKKDQSNGIAFVVTGDKNDTNITEETNDKGDEKQALIGLEGVCNNLSVVSIDERNLSNSDDYNTCEENANTSEHCINEEPRFHSENIRR